MSPILLAILVMVMVGALGAAFVPSIAGSARAEQRKKALQGELRVGRPVASAEKLRESRRKSVQEVLKAQTRDLEKRRSKFTLQQRIFQAGLKTRRQDFIRNSVILGLALFAVCFILEVPLVFSLIFGAAGGYVLPQWYLGRKRRKFQSLFLDELPNAVEAIVRGVKSGMPLNDSIRLVSKEVKEPVRSEFARVLDQQSLGMSMTEAVQVLMERVPLPEVNFFVVVITVQQQAGGNLSEALGNLARVLRNRKKMAAKVKAMSAEAKASAMIIGALPFLVAGLVSLLTPTYLVPLFTTNIGLLCLGGAGIMMSMGIFIMNRMIQFDF